MDHPRVIYHIPFYLDISAVCIVRSSKVGHYETLRVSMYDLKLLIKEFFLTHQRDEKDIIVGNDSERKTQKNSLSHPYVLRSHGHG